MYKKIFILPLVVLYIFSSSCRKQDSSIINSELSTYPQPTQNKKHLFPTPKPNSTIIHGILLVKQPELSLPSPDDGIFLIPFPKDTDISVLYTYNLENAYQADVDEQTGKFVFSNIPPGQYIIIIKTISGAIIPAVYPENKGYAIIQLTNNMLGKSVEIGPIILQ